MASEVVRRMALLLSESAGGVRFHQRLVEEFRVLRVQAMDRAFFATGHGEKFFRGGR